MSTKNMVAMFGVMAMMRRIDQEEPIVLRYARLGFVIYVLVTAAIYMILHFRITSRRDTTEVRVPKKAKAPSMTDAFKNAAEKAERAERARRGEEDTSPAQENNNNNTDGSNEEDEGEFETITAMEYDLRHLSSARRSWIMNACFLSAIHYKMESVSPLIITPIMGTLRMFTDDPLFQIHILGSPAVEKLQRPFKPEVNPLQNMLKDFVPKAPSEAQTSAVENSQTTSTQPNGTVSGANGNATAEEELHDDGDSEEEDEAPRGIADLADDHIKGDFDEEQDDNEVKPVDEAEKKDQ